MVAYALANLWDTNLNIEQVAVQHHFSIRRVQQVFQEQGLTFRDWVRHERLVRIHRDLIDPSLRHLPIAVIASMLLSGAGCNLAPQVQIKPVTLEYWRIQDDQPAMADQIEAYRKLHPNVEIVYRKMREEDYEKLLHATIRNPKSAIRNPQSAIRNYYPPWIESRAMENFQCSLPHT